MSPQRRWNDAADGEAPWTKALHGYSLAGDEGKALLVSPPHLFQ